MTRIVNRNASRLLLPLLLLLSCSSAWPRVVEAYSRAYGPRQNMRVAKPTLQWEVWAGQDAKITSTKMLLNGREVPAKYDSRTKTLSYTPSSPLKPGRYQVQCRVLVENRLEVKKDWKFEVAANAIPEINLQDETRWAALAEANRIRRAFGLPEFVQDDRMSAAAVSHSKYLSLHNATGHYQKSGTEGFVGNQPFERLESYGFRDSSYECVDYGGKSAEESVWNIFHAPYHRIPFLQPGELLAGAGYENLRLTMEFQMTEESATVVSPYHGQSDVPLEWRQNERPNPLRMHRAKGGVGYPIVFAHFGEEYGKKIRIRSVRMTQNGQDVPVFVNKPSNDDELDNASIIFPQKPLKPLTTYVVSVRAKNSAGQDISKTWSFTTAASGLVARR